MRKKAKDISNTLKINKKLFDLISYTIDRPVLILNNQHELIYSNEQMQEYLPSKPNKNTLKKVIKGPFVYIHNLPKSISDLYDICRKSNTKNVLKIDNVIVLDEGKEKRIILHLALTSVEKGVSYLYISMIPVEIAIGTPNAYYVNTETDLPNYRKAVADIGIMANKMRASKKKFAVALLSIDNFLEIKSSIGYDGSYTITLLVAKYFKELLSKENFQLYHFSEDSFMLILSGMQTEQECSSWTERHKSVCEHMLHQYNNTVHFTLSAGICIYPSSTHNKLIQTAHQALLLARKKGLGCTITKVSHSLDHVPADTIQYNDIKKALENNEFVLYYQPIYDLEKNIIVGAEALIRWAHPEKGILTPYHFLPIVEKTSFMKPLSEYVSRKAIEQLATWKKLGFRKIQVSINLSMREFEEEDYPHILDTLLKKNAIETSQLKVEITENIAMTNEKYSLAQFTKLKESGIEISLDDFGTGYSSFSMLEAFPIDTLKIDKSFVTDMVKNEDHYSIVKAMISMAHSLNIKVIAEGIEDKEVASLLGSMMCDYVQGYYFSRPIPAFEFQELIRHNQTSDIDGIIILDPL